MENLAHTVERKSGQVWSYVMSKDVCGWNTQHPPPPGGKIKTAFFRPDLRLLLTLLALVCVPASVP